MIEPQTMTQSPETQEPTLPVVLIVEDEAHVASLYRRMLGDEYTVQMAASGEEALEKLDEHVDVVLLDRMMPGLQGADVLAIIRDEEINCRVAMVTAVEPDLDIVEMGFDAYVQKPPTRAQLRQTVADLIERGTYTAELQEYYAALSKRAVLATRQSDEVSESSEYAALDARISTFEARLDQAALELTDDLTILSLLRAIEETGEKAT